MIKLYSTNCPKCKILETKLNTKKIEYTICTDVDTMTSLGIQSVPALQINDNEILMFADAVKWVNAI